MRRLALGIGIGVAITALGAAVYAFFFRALEGDTPEWILSSYSGTVEVSSDAGKVWTPAELKMRLRGTDRIRTSSEGEATLVHEESHVTVRASTSVAVARLSEKATEFALDEGMVFVEARGDRIRMRGFGGQVAEGRQAGFGMTVTTDGLARVQVKRGDIDFTSMGHTTVVHEGQESEARAGHAPSRPVEIPKALYMSVKFPDADTFNTRLARIEGRVTRGDRVSVAGRTVTTDPDGRFSVQVELDEGMNQIEVTGTDALGRHRTERSHPIRVDTQAPGLEGVTIGRHSVEAGSRGS